MEHREELLATVASLYYRLNQSQGEIAERLDVSIATISRYLKEARERGIVQFNIRMPIPRDFELGPSRAILNWSRSSSSATG